MANNIITSQIIVNKTLAALHNSSAFLGNIDVQYEEEFAKKGAKVGSTINIRQPVQFTVRNGATANIQDVNETTVPLTIQPEIGIDWAFSDYDLTLSIDEFDKRYLQPAGARLATELDTRIGSLYSSVWNLAGTPGTPPATVASALDAAVYLDNNAAPRDGWRVAAIDPVANAKLVAGMANVYHAQDRNSQQVKDGLMKTNLGLDFQMSQNLPTHTVGGLGGTPLVNGANQGIINAGSTDNPYAATTSLVTDGWTAAAANRLRKGDVFTIDGVYAVNPDNKVSTGQLQQFVVTADTASDGSGNATVVISPAIIAGGAYQNVTARPADNAPITVRSGTANTAYKQNMLFHKSAITLATIDMELPKGMDMAARGVYENVALRFVRGYDIINNRRICRFDLLTGYTMQRPQWAARLTS